MYGLAAAASNKGAPLIRPLVFDFPDDPVALEQAHSFMFGPALHVAPVLEEGAREWRVYLPRNPGGWYDFWTGTHREGGRWHEVPAELEHIPLHVRAGTILPLGPVVQSTAGALERELELRVYPGRDGASALYADDGTSYRYEEGAFSRTALAWDEAEGVLSLGARSGCYPGMVRQRSIVARLVGMDPAGPVTREATYMGAALRITLRWT